jgi:hypothetical protein
VARAILELADALRTAIQTLTTRVVTRRYVPFFSAEEVKDGKWFVMVAEEDPRSKRNIDSPLLSIDLAYQQSLPESTEENPGDPVDDNSIMDPMLEEVKTIQALFDEGGLLRDAERLGRFVLQSHRPTTLYRQDWLYEYGIFISVIRLEFFDEGI